MNIELYELSGILAFLIAWFGMLLTVLSRGKDKTKSISLHAASSKKTFILLAILSPISMSLFTIFAAKWMTPELSLPPLFIALSVIANTGYILASWIPATKGPKLRLHDFFAYGASLLLVPIAFILATSPNVAAIPRIINVFSLLIMASILDAMLWHKPAKFNYLYFQIAYFLSSGIGLLAAGYIT